MTIRAGFPVPNVPASSGAYILFSGRICLYVGSTINLRRRIGYHNLRGQFDRFEFQECAAEAMVELENSLIAQHSPVINQIAARASRFVRKHRDGVTRLQQIRASRGETVRVVADRVGINAGNYSRLERGDLAPELKYAQKIAVALAVPLESIFTPIRFVATPAGEV